MIQLAVALLQVRAPGDGLQVRNRVSASTPITKPSPAIVASQARRSPRNWHRHLRSPAQLWGGFCPGPMKQRNMRCVAHRIPGRVNAQRRLESQARPT